MIVSKSFTSVTNGNAALLRPGDSLEQGIAIEVIQS